MTGEGEWEGKRVESSGEKGKSLRSSVFQIIDALIIIILMQPRGGRFEVSLGNYNGGLIRNIWT